MPEVPGSFFKPGDYYLSDNIDVHFHEVWRHYKTGAIALSTSYWTQIIQLKKQRQPWKLIMKGSIQTQSLIRAFKALVVQS